MDVGRTNFNEVSPTQSLKENARRLSRMIELDLEAYNEIENIDPEIVFAQFRKTEGLIESFSQLVNHLYGNSNYDRYKEKLLNQQKNFRLIRNAWLEKKNREKLFGTTSWHKNDDIEVDIIDQKLLNDNSSIERSSQNVRQFIENGDEVLRLIYNGNITLGSSARRLHDIINGFFDINQAMNVIRRAGLKNTVVIGLVIAACICILIFSAL